MVRKKRKIVFVDNKQNLAVLNPMPCLEKRFAVNL